MTDSLELTFIGICTHLWEDQPNAQPNTAWGKRIVMPNAADPLKVEEINLLYMLNPPIFPHVATLAFPLTSFVSKSGPKDFFPWQGNEGEVTFTFLDGVMVTVANPSPEQINKNARCLLSLSAFVPDVAPGEAATSFDASQAAGYFDFQTGTLNGVSYGSRNKAAGILYTTPTVGPAQITITPFDTSVAPTTVQLSSGLVEAYILNIPIAGDKDNDNDFLLNFLSANQFPGQTPQLGPACLSHPHGPRILEMLRIDGDDFGVGCSNTNIP